MSVRSGPVQDTRNLLALDLGTTKVAALLGRTQPQARPELLGIGLAPSAGLQRGIVTNLKAGVAAIRAALEQLRRTINVTATRAWVGVTGEHIDCVSARASITLERLDHRIHAEDIERVLRAAARSISLPADREIIHTIARDFRLDGEKGFRNPVSLVGSRLEVEAHLITAPAQTIENVERCVEEAGLEVEELVLQPVASAEAVLTDAERELGVALLDIGGGTTDMALFSEGSLVYNASISLGGQQVTRDLAIGLQVPPEEAEQLKRTAAVAIADHVPPEQLIEVSAPDRPERRPIPRRFLSHIVESRMREIFELAQQELARCPYWNRTGAGVVLTGGASHLKGTVELASEVFERPARVGHPPDLGLGGSIANSPDCATGVGLILYAAQEAERNHFARRTRGLRQQARSLWHRARELFTPD